MASPFPGIDPYLEAQGLWEGFHTGFVTYCRDALNDALPENYVAQLDEHLRLVDLSEKEPKLVIPDVMVARGGRKSTIHSRRAKKPGVTATIEPVRSALPRVKIEVHGVWIEILRLPKRTPVSVIEVLSPTNKTGEGFFEYNQKRRATIRQQVHLVEFDCLLRGDRLPMERPLPTGDFYAVVSRFEERPESDVYAWTLRDPLPSIPIPLSRPDPDVMLDLAPVFATAYERGRYARLIDYSVPPSTVKKPADRTWAQRTARAARR